MVLDLKGKKAVIEPGSIVLVTGVTGLLGSHTADQLLQAGYKVRGTTRDAKKAEWEKELFGKRYGDGVFTVHEVPDATVEGAFDEALQGASGVIHLASDLSFGSDPNKVIPPTLSMLLRVLHSAAATPTVKRFVYTSSSTALTHPKPNERFKIDTSMWNEEDVKAAWAPPSYEAPRAWAVYGASKTQAEQELWKFAREQNPNFVVNAVLPNANFGTILNPAQPASTAAWVTGIAQSGSLDKVKGIPEQWFVDVQDTARLHVAALVHPDVQSERLLAFAEPYTWNQILQILRKVLPGKQFQDDIPNEPQDLSSLNNSRPNELLKLFGRDGFTSLEESIKNNVQRL